MTIHNVLFIAIQFVYVLGHNFMLSWQCKCLWFASKGHCCDVSSCVELNGYRPSRTQPASERQRFHRLCVQVICLNNCVLSAGTSTCYYWHSNLWC